MLLMIDNYDSFTYTLVNYLQSLSVEVVVCKNDEIDIEGIKRLAPDHLMISPGPCTPNEAGVSLQAIEHFAGQVPILGVCLGHQAIGQVFGAKVVNAGRVMHGKTSVIHHREQCVFNGLPREYVATRYHSLVLDKHSLPECLEVTAWTELEQGGIEEIMAVKHRVLPVQGVQFHPESILTEYGLELLANFVSKDAQI